VGPSYDFGGLCPTPSLAPSVTLGTDLEADRSAAVLVERVEDVVRVSGAVCNATTTSPNSTRLVPPQTALFKAGSVAEWLACWTRAQ